MAATMLVKNVTKFLSTLWLKWRTTVTHYQTFQTQPKTWIDRDIETHLQTARF